jgi:hypothetical protein
MHCCPRSCKRKQRARFQNHNTPADRLRQLGKSAEYHEITGDGVHIDGIFNIARVGDLIRSSWVTDSGNDFGSIHTADQHCATRVRRCAMSCCASQVFFYSAFTLLTVRYRAILPGASDRRELAGQSRWPTDAFGPRIAVGIPLSRSWPAGKPASQPMRPSR